ncbi:anaphase-promoting complex subunit 7 isoform X1 [Folsomia candida]|uniref:anaphase-promoting complex subunit 7 isoform X1 n=1 Tax=Folsomia candida TaxID=158441 RepID=UPI001604D175|nr:anaphase-promoting complex subunit 7 isoform X1 [Folsomia candida]XP_035712161.1 anaphase-promoting complex subunit 7 isoform X1 [Folsomia candida]
MMAFLKSSKTFYLDQITVMFKEQLYSSVLSFGSVALNLGERYPEHVSEAQQVTILIMCGDSAYFTHDYVQAESFYRKALQLGKSLSKGSTSKECVPEDNNDIKYKLYLCLMQCKKPEEALNMLQSIPAKGRAVRTNMALGKLYKQNGMERAAITAFKEVLKECPTSMEAIESLISLGLGDTDLQVFFNHKLNKMPYSEWFHNWIRALQQLFLRDYPSALQTLNTLTDHTPLKHNRYMLHTLSLAYTLEGNYEEAIGPLLLCHRLEPGNMYGMDLLAFLLWSKKKLLTLQSLANRLSDVNYNENRPEAWIALGYYSLLMEPTQKGLSFAERALTCTGTKSYEALVCKGYLLLGNKKAQEALECFREASQLCGNRFEPHNGLVRCYLELQRYRDASTVANGAMKKLGQTPRVLTMCAQPLSKEPLNFSKAKSCLDKALQLNKRHWPAVLTLTQILEEEGHYDVAVQKLQEYADGGPTRVRFHLRMAHLLSKMRSNDEAADHYAITLRLDPNNRDALEGLDRLDFRTIMVKEEETEVTSRDIGVSPFNIDDDYQEEPGWVPLNQFAVGERL